MCFKKEIINWEHAQKVAILFGKNNYPSPNELSFCVNDVDLIKSKVSFFGVQARRFTDYEVTRKNFRNQLTYAFTNAVAGDTIFIGYSGHGSYVKDQNSDEIDGFDETLYMDGHFTDDETAELCRLIPAGVTVIFFLDCCYSGTSTRTFSKARFMPPKKKYPLHKRVKRGHRGDLPYIVFSACKENETSEEAIINGQGNGVFTYWAMTTLDPNLTYRKWYEKIRIYLPSKTFEQTPLLEGNDQLLDKLIFT